MFEVFSLACIAALGAMSPGPDFAVVSRFALLGSKRAASLASLGIATALLIHMIYCSLGIAILFLKVPALFYTVQLAGSIYLAYLGIGLLRSSPQSQEIDASTNIRRAFFSGFFCNLLNPKATLFMFGIFTQFLTPSLPWHVLIFYMAVILAVTLLWFFSLSYFITHPMFKKTFLKNQIGLMRGMGILLLLLATLVAGKTLWALF